MARQRREPDPKPNLELDAITERAADPGAAAGSHALSGFLGKGPDGRLRLYETPALDSYYEFDGGDVVHSVKHEGELGGTTVWLRQGAPITHTVATSAAAQQSFLQGPISGAAAQAGLEAQSPNFIWPSRFDCSWVYYPCGGSWYYRCGSWYYRCSWFDACGSWICAK